MIIEINPLDALFFRDGKAFAAGEDTWADGMFPPSPSVIYGALRTAYFANNIEKFEEFRRSSCDENSDPTRNLRIKGIYLRDTSVDSTFGSDSLLFPVPLDMVSRKYSYKLCSLTIKNKDEDVFCSLNTLSIIGSEIDGEFEEVENGVINNIQDYLSGTYKDNPVHEMEYIQVENNYVEVEPKIGIMRNKDTRSSEDENLYRVGMYRLRNLSIIVDFEGLDDIPEEGLMKLGGEGKAVSYKKIKNITILSKYKPTIKNNRFKLYLATPAIFKDGWVPGWIDSGINGIKLELLAAAVGKYISIGGFDMKRKRPKTMYRAVPAGSVYYFEIPENVDSKSIIDTFHNQTVSEMGTEKEGFGLAFVGVL